VSSNTKKEKALNILPGGCQSGWFMSKTFERVSEAFAREKQVQNWSRAKREALIHGKPDLLPELAKKDFSKRKANS
jgi:hypothetical protein